MVESVLHRRLEVFNRLLSCGDVGRQARTRRPVFLGFKEQEEMNETSEHAWLNAPGLSTGDLLVHHICIDRYIGIVIHSP